MAIEQTLDPHYPLTLFFDGACAVCNLEMDNLKARNAGGPLRFVDIAAPSMARRDAIVQERTRP